MKHIKALSLVSILFVASFVLSACSEKDDRYQAERSELTLKLNESIRKIDLKITDLERQREGASESVTDMIDKNIDTLKERKEVLEDRRDDINNTLDDKWDAFKADVNKSIDDTENWLENAKLDVQEELNMDKK